MGINVKGFNLLKIGQNRYDFKLKSGKRKIAYEILEFNENEIEFMTNSVMFFSDKGNDVKIKKDIVKLSEIEEIIEK